MSIATASLIASALLLGLAPLRMPAGYSWRRETISDSAAQGVAFAWIARWGLFLLGWGAAWTALGADGLRLDVRGALCTFGVAMVCSAVWSKRDWRPVPAFDAAADRRHSWAAQAAGVAYTLATLLHLQARFHGGFGLDALTLVALLSAVLCPLLTFRRPAIGGAAQRAMFAVSYFWIGTLPG